MGTRSLLFRLSSLAVVFDTFNDIEKRRFSALLLHSEPPSSTPTACLSASG